jgi:hypothetical protein
VQGKAPIFPETANLDESRQRLSTIAEAPSFQEKAEANSIIFPPSGFDTKVAPLFSSGNDMSLVAENSSTTSSNVDKLIELLRF